MYFVGFSTILQWLHVLIPEGLINYLLELSILAIDFSIGFKSGLI